MHRIVAALLSLAAALTLRTAPAGALQDAAAERFRPALRARLSGVVYDSIAGAPLEHAMVQLLLRENRGAARTVLSDSLGRFAFVDVPPGSWILGFLHPRTDAVEQGGSTYLLTVSEADSAIEIELFIPRMANRIANQVSATERVWRVRGTVSDSAGLPVTNAVVFDTTGRLRARSDERGMFALSGHAAGGHRFEVRALGFAPTSFTVSPARDHSAALTIRLSRVPTVLATVTTTARRTIAGFHARRGRGGGQFLDAADIARRRPTAVAEAITRLQGVVVLPRTSFSSPIRFRPSVGKLCEPAVFIDGVQMLGPTTDLDAFVDVDEIEAMELYTKGGEVPAEFVAYTPCGAILIWRKSGRPLP